jgi:hypothetical protein
MKVILFLLTFVSFAFAQQLNYTFGVDAVGSQLTGSFTSLDSTGATNYEVYVDLHDYYPGFDINPAVYDSVNSSTGSGPIASSDLAVLFTLYYYIDADAATDSTNIDIDVSSGVYSSSALVMATTKFDPTPVKQVDVVAANDVFGHVNVYTESGKLWPPEVVKINFDVDPAAAEVSAGLDIYYRIVYPQIYESAEEKYNRSD